MSMIWARTCLQIVTVDLLKMVVMIVFIINARKKRKIPSKRKLQRLLKYAKLIMLSLVMQSSQLMINLFTRTQPTHLTMQMTCP
jgi:hypothetical protein